MKINFNHPQPAAANAGQAPKKPSPETAFKSLLKDTLSQPSVEKAKQRAVAHPMAVGRPDLRLKETLNFRTAVARIDQFLDVLDSYRSGLADPNVTLRDLYPLLRRIDTEKEHLAAMKSELCGDDRLREILDEVLVNATLEVAKFNRGDYV